MLTVLPCLLQAHLLKNVVAIAAVLGRKNIVLVNISAGLVPAIIPVAVAKDRSSSRVASLRVSYESSGKEGAVDLYRLLNAIAGLSDFSQEGVAFFLASFSLTYTSKNV